VVDVLEFQDIVKLHIDVFGVEPVITGINYNKSENTDLKILEAIEIGIPYIEQEIPEGVST
jgi:hypothetical protein